MVLPVMMIPRAFLETALRLPNANSGAGTGVR
jgi:hypothetical protein